MRNTIPAWAPKGLFFTVLEDHKRTRYPRAAHSGARIFHYGWARTESQIQKNKDLSEKFWSDRKPEVNLRAVDSEILRRFEGTHPAVMADHLPPAEGLYLADPHHRLTRRERKHRAMLCLERWFGFEFNKNHFRRIR